MLQMAIGVACAAWLIGAGADSPQTASGSPGQVIATVRIGHPVLAGGRPLPAGTYQVRLTDERPASGVDRWVELVADGRVVAREGAVAIPATEIDAIAERTPPRPGQVRVERLKGGEFLRIWVNYQGTHYLIHLPEAAAGTVSRR